VAMWFDGREKKEDINMYRTVRSCRCEKVERCVRKRSNRHYFQGSGNSEIDQRNSCLAYFREGRHSAIGNDNECEYNHQVFCGVSAGIGC
jgi:hypothetical protein